MRGMADLASRFTLSFDVEVTQSLGDEQKRQHSHSESKHPHPVTSRLVSTNHLEWPHYTDLPSETRPCPSRGRPRRGAGSVALNFEGSTLPMRSRRKARSSPRRGTCPTGQLSSRPRGLFTLPPAPIKFDKRRIRRPLK
jgi:hypothetical protein